MKEPMGLILFILTLGRLSFHKTLSVKGHALQNQNRWELLPTDSLTTTVRLTIDWVNFQVFSSLLHAVPCFLSFLDTNFSSTLVFWIGNEQTLRSPLPTYLSLKEPRNSDRVLHELCCAYQFEVDGVSYKGSGCGLPIPSIYNDENNREWAIKNFEKESNGRIEILYNTKDPSESVILTQKWIIANGIVILISSGLLFLLFKFTIGYFRRKYSVKGSAPLSTTNTVGS